MNHDAPHTLFPAIPPRVYSITDGDDQNVASLRKLASRASIPSKKALAWGGIDSQFRSMACWMLATLWTGLFLSARWRETFLRAALLNTRVVAAAASPPLPLAMFGRGGVGCVGRRWS